MKPHQKRLKKARHDERLKDRLTMDAAQVCMDVLGVVPVYVLLELYGWKRIRLSRFIQRYAKVMQDVTTKKVSIKALEDEIYQQTKIRHDNGDWYDDRVIKGEKK